jgi:hypothetical protein
MKHRTRNAIKWSLDNQGLGGRDGRRQAISSLAGKGTG